MRREKVDRRIGVENSLRAVAVMHVPVEDRDALDLRIVLLCVTRRHRNVIEQTKTHRSFFSRVMTRRTHGNESVLYLATHNQINSLARSSRRVSRCVERTHRDDRVRVEITGAFAYDTFDLLVELWRVSRLNIAARRFSRLHLHETGP